MVDPPRPGRNPMTLFRHLSEALRADFDRVPLAIWEAAVRVDSLVEPCGRCHGTDAVWMGDPDAGDGDEVWQEPCPECAGGSVPSELLRSVVGAGLGRDVLRLINEGGT